MGSHEVVDFSDSKIFVCPNNINSDCFWSHISQKSMPSLTSQLCGISLMAVIVYVFMVAFYWPHMSIGFAQCAQNYVLNNCRLSGMKVLCVFCVLIQ